MIHLCFTIYVQYSQAFIFFNINTIQHNNNLLIY